VASDNTFSKLSILDWEKAEQTAQNINQTTLPYLMWNNVFFDPGKEGFQDVLISEN